MAEYGVVDIAKPLPPVKRFALTVYSYIWNLCRRPFVRVWQKELTKIAVAIRANVLSDWLDACWGYCANCRELRRRLECAVFASDIKLILRTGTCSEHREWAASRLSANDHLFKRSKELSDKICGFNSNEK